MQKPPRGVSLYSSRVNRPVGRWLAAAADTAGMTPNQLTGLSALASFGGVALIASATRSVPVGVAAAALLLLGFALDSADGQLARLRRSGSAAGGWLDHMVDGAVKLTLHGAVLIAWWHEDFSGGWLFLPLAFGWAAMLLFLGGSLAEKVYTAPREQPRIRASVLLLPVDNGIICLAFLLWGVDNVFRWAYLGLFAAHLLFLVGFSTRWYRELT